MTLVIQETGTFSGYKLGTGTNNLRNITLRILRQSDTTRYSPTNGAADYDWIDDALNRGQEEFVRQTKCLQTYCIIEMKSGYRVYRLPADYIDMKAAYFYDASLSAGYIELPIKDIEELNDEVSDWRIKSGDPRYIYLDKIYGNQYMCGFYPIPDTDGGTITFSSDYGLVVDWVCPNYTFSQEYGVIVRMTDTDQFFLNTDGGVVNKVTALDKNVWIEYYRLPLELAYSTQYPEIPKEYQKALCYYAAYDLLSHNPEDSVEFKRSMIYKQDFAGEIKTYLSKRKRPLWGKELQAKPFQWSWQKSMPYYKANF